MSVAVYKTRASVEGTLHLFICGLSKLPSWSYWNRIIAVRVCFSKVFSCMWYPSSANSENGNANSENANANSENAKHLVGDYY